MTVQTGPAGSGPRSASELRPGAGTPTPGMPGALPGLTRLRPGWLLAGLAALVLVALIGVVVGPVRLDPIAVLRDLVGLDSGLSASDRTIVYELRLPRVVLAMLVGATLAISGAAYQGVFGNPLADPYLLGVAAGAGLGATVAIAVAGVSAAGTPYFIPIFAFVGALASVALTYTVGTAGGRRSSATTLILSGVAVASFMTALQTFVQQRYQETIREVYSWILGRLTTAGWNEVLVLLPYTALAVGVLLANRWVLDVLVLGDDEAAALGLHPRRIRLVIVAAASLATAAAVSVSGLIGFVGVIVPHTVRLLAGAGHRVVLPLSLLFGAAFLVVADLLARMLLSPAELPIGVITAFFGAPFFVLVLHLSRRQLT